MFCSKKSTKKINAVHERSLRIIWNDYESLYSLLLLEEAHQIAFHQWCISSLMIEVYKYMNGHSPDIVNDIFKLENKCNLWNFHIFQTENRCSLKYEVDAIPYCTSQLWQQVPIDICEAASLTLFKNRIKTWKCENCPCRSCKMFIQNVGYIWLGPISNWL